MSWKCQLDGTENPDPEQGEYLLLRVKTDIGKALCKRFGPDSEFWTNPQFTCEPLPRDEDEGWQIIPNTKAKNETLINGRAITSPQVVKSGDILSVGRESKGIIKLPLLVNPDIDGAKCAGCGANPFLILQPVSIEEAEERLAGNEMDASFTEEVTEEEIPAEESPAEESPVEESPVEESPVEEALVEEALVEEALVEEALVEEALVEEALVEEALVEEALVEEVSAEEVPAEETPTEEVAPEPVVVESGTMDVVITGCGISTYDANKVLKELMPDAGIFDIYKLLKNFPQVAFENLPPEEAEDIKARLESADCTVELRPHSS
jgi:ribosomal protein L7/L12